MRWQPKPYHEEALAHALDGDVQLWLDKGLGKTSVAASMVAEKMDRAQVARTLLVTTRRIAASTWPRELRKWDHLNDIPYRYITGSQKECARMLGERWAGIEAITVGRMKWLWRHYLPRLFRRRGGKLPWQQIIFDESSLFKDPSTQRFESIRHWQSSFPDVLNLTGSPAPQGLHGVWGPTFLIDGGERLSPQYTAFKQRWFRVPPAGYGLEPQGQWAVDEIHRRLEDITVSMSAEDYLDLPPLIINDVWVDLPRSARVLYEQMEREMFLILEQGTVDVANGGVLTSKCRQVANGFLYLDGGTERWQTLHKEKLEALAEVVEEAEGENIITAYQFKADKVLLKERYKRALVMDEVDEAIVEDEWNSGRHSMLLMHPASGGHGLNLQDGGRQMAMFGCPWSFDQFDQCKDRIAGGLRRQRPTFIHRILARDTVDADIIEALERNETIQDVLKRRLKNRRRLTAVA